MKNLKPILLLLFIIPLCLKSFGQTSAQNKSRFVYNDTLNVRITKLIKSKDYFKAKKEILKGIDRSKKLNDLKSLGVFYTKKGKLELIIERYEDAYKSFKLAELHSYKIKDYVNLGFVYFNLTLYEIHTKNFGKAIIMLEKSEKNFSKIDKTFFQDNIILKKIEIPIHQKEYEKAWELLTKFEKEFKRDFSQRSIAKFYYLQAETAFNLGKSPIKYANKSIKICEKNKQIIEYEIKNYDLLSEVYKRRNKYRKALEYYEKKEAIVDSLLLLNQSSSKRLTDIQPIQDFNLEQEKKLNKEKDELKKYNPFGKNTTVIFIAIFLMLCVIIYLLASYNFEKKKHNAELELKNKELKKANSIAKIAIEARDKFLNTVTHEIRTPLYAVIGLSEILIENNPKPEQIKHLESLNYSGDYLLNFINNILQQNKLNSKQIILSNEDINVKDVTKNIINTLEKSSNPLNNSITYSFDKDIPNSLLGDKTKFTQILLNIIGNALKFTKEGEIKVTLKLKEKNKNNVTIIIIVKDNGVGINLKDQKKIFESFTQINEGQSPIASSGLGLSIVKKLVNLLKGSINLKSEVNKGSTFIIEIPFKVNQTQKKEEVKTNYNKDYSKYKMLVVDDNKVNQMVTNKYLQQLKISSDTASNGKEAVDKVKESKYDLILMDINMPIMDGYEATKEIRGLNIKTPIIALTALSFELSVKSLEEKGFNNFITKPFKKEDFYDIITSYLTKKKK